MGIVLAAQPTSRQAKALRLREPLMRRQLARRVEQRMRDDEAWARIEDEEQLLRDRSGRRDGQEDMLREKRPNTKAQAAARDEEAQGEDRAVEARQRQARVEERRRMMRRADEGRSAIPTGRRRSDQRAEGGESPPVDARSRQAQQYVRQRLARKVGGFADIVAMATKEDSEQRDVERGGTTGVARGRGRGGEASGRPAAAAAAAAAAVLDEASVGDDFWDF